MIADTYTHTHTPLASACTQTQTLTSGAPSLLCSFQVSRFAHTHDFGGKVSEQMVCDAETWSQEGGGQGQDTGSATTVAVQQNLPFFLSNWVFSLCIFSFFSQFHFFSPHQSSAYTSFSFLLPLYFSLIPFLSSSFNFTLHCSNAAMASICPGFTTRRDNV